jgi:hypothetical protein
MTPMQLAGEVTSFTTAMTDIGSGPSRDVETRRRSSASGVDSATRNQLARDTVSGWLESRATASDTRRSTSVCRERKERIRRGGTSSESERNTHDLAFGCWMAVRRMSSNRTSLAADVEAEAVGI